MRIPREPIPRALESLRCLHVQVQAFRGPLHRHGHVELTWIERGQGLRWVGDSVEPFFEGDLVLVGSETPHLWSSQGAPTPGGCAATVLQFPADWLRSLALPELGPLAQQLAGVAGGLVVQGATRAEVQGLLRRLPGASAPRRVAVGIDALACVFTGAGAGTGDLRVLPAPRRASPAPRRASRMGERTAVAGRQRVDDVLDWVESNLAAELSIDDAAAVARISPAAFGRFFRREVGKSFTAYVNDARCGWAALLLVQGREPIAHIAQTCGFTTLSNFGEQFRRRFGVAPRAFRVGGAGAAESKPAPAAPDRASRWR
jgi:AraC-like DNA-binding protein